MITSYKTKKKSGLGKKIAIGTAVIGLGVGGLAFNEWYQNYKNPNTGVIKLELPERPTYVQSTADED